MAPRKIVSDEPIVFSPLVAAVITAQFEIARSANTRLIEVLQANLAEALAQLDAVRAGVSVLFRSPYMPTPDAVLTALWPSREAVQAFLPEEEH